MKKKNLKLQNCRVCGNKFFKNPLLVYKNMPEKAQYFPEMKPSKLDKGINLNVLQCTGCGLVQLDNKPVNYYREVIRSTDVSGEMKQFRVKQFSSFIEEYNLKGKKIIEIGCGKGEYLKIMQQINKETYGLEFSEESVNSCLKENLIVFHGYIEEENFKIKKGPYKAFFILNFLEHLPNINTVLRGIYNNLTEDGVGLVEVPNFNMILEKKLFSEFMNDHLFYFTEETIKTALKLNGFKIIACETVWHDYVISLTVKKLKRMQINEFYDHQNLIKKEIGSYINKFKGKKVAIWGAGHQALAIISLTGISDNIEYIVDSAPFKQNKYTPSSYLPIFSPKKLKENPIDAIIVMAASFSDEIYYDLKNNFEGNFSIAILRDDRLEIVR